MSHAKPADAGQDCLILINGGQSEDDKKKLKKRKLNKKLNMFCKDS